MNNYNFRAATGYSYDAGRPQHHQPVFQQVHVVQPGGYGAPPQHTGFSIPAVPAPIQHHHDNWEPVYARYTPSVASSSEYVPQPYHRGQNRGSARQRLGNAAAPRRKSDPPRGQSHHSQSPSKNPSGGVQKKRKSAGGGGMSDVGFSNGRASRGRSVYGHGRRGPPSKPSNSASDIPVESLAKSTPSHAFSLDADDALFFHGFQSPFTTQHNFPVMIDDVIYESCDHYYQLEKVRQLCPEGTEVDACMTQTLRDKTGKRLDGGVGFRGHYEKSFSSMAREMLKKNKVDKKVVDEWRYQGGLAAMQRALSAKVQQCESMRGALRESGDKLLVHCYAGDAIYGSGASRNVVVKWMEKERQQGRAAIKIPVCWPLDASSIRQCPTLCTGRNLLGVILMGLRKRLKEGLVTVEDLSGVFSALRPGGAADPMDVDDLLADPPVVTNPDVSLTLEDIEKLEAEIGL